MSQEAMVHVSAESAVEVCGRFAPGEAAKGLLREDQTPRQFLDVLIENGEFPDAVRFLAYALPKREAVWWACLCARTASGPNPPAPILAALRRRGVGSDPSEENARRRCPSRRPSGSRRRPAASRSRRSGAAGASTLRTSPSSRPTSP
ncbi:MAG: hypothetical protein WKF75_16235 [Singulisphaera sp.]